MPIPTRTEASLTGRVRARPGWFGKQVLQVEVKCQMFSACPAPPGHQDPAAWREFCRRGQPWNIWRDATWDDLNTRRAPALQLDGLAA